MRIVLLTAEYPPDQGGVGDYTGRLGQALLALGQEVRVVTGPAATAEAVGDGLPVTRLPIGWGWRDRHRLIAALADASPDIVNIQYQTGAYRMRPMINLLPLSWRRPARPAIVTTFHDLRVPYLFPKAGPVRMWVNALLLRGSDGAIFTTAEDQRAASRLPWMAADRPVACVPIGSNIDRAPPPGYDRAAFRATLGLSQEALLLAYFGLTNPSKGLGDLLVACARLRGEGLPIRLALIGGGTGATDPTNRAEAARLEQLIAELALAPILLQPGFLPPAEVSAYLLAADLAVQPYRDGVSLRRGSLMAVLAHGLPLVTTAPDPAASPLRPDVEAVLVPPGDVEALAAAIRALATDPARRARLGFAAAQRAREFQWDRIATAVLEHYAAALAGRAQRQGP